MASREELEVKSMKVTLEQEGSDEEKKVNFVVEELANVKVEFSDSNVDDIKRLFDRVFEYVVNENKLIHFYLESETSDIQVLFQEIASDLIDHLNAEIENSKDDFVEIIQFKEQYETIG